MVSHQVVEQAASLIAELPKNSMVIAGPYFAPLTYKVLQGRLNAESKVVYYCNPARQDSILNAGGLLYHLPGQDDLNNRVYQTTQTKSVLLPGMSP